MRGFREHSFRQHKKLVHGLLSAAIMFRIVEQILEIMDETEIWMVLLITSVAGMTFWMTFMLVLVLWARIYSHASPTPTVTHRLTNLLLVPKYGVIAVLLVLIIFALPVLHVIDSDISFRSIDKATLICRAVLNILCAAGFAWYGSRLLHILSEIYVIPNRRSFIKRKVAAVTIICTSSFLVRAATIVIEAVNCHGTHCNSQNLELASESIFVVVGELPPIMCVLVITQLQIGRMRDMNVNVSYGALS